MYLLLKNIIGLAALKINQKLGRFSVQLANLCLLLFFRKVRFKRRLDISANVYQVTEITESLPGQKEWTHFFHMPERLHNYTIGVVKKGERLAQNYCIENLKFEENDVILDIGANSGDSLIYFRSLGLPLSIYCFEPDPRALESLNANAASWPECVEVVPSPLGEIEGPVTLYISTLGGDTSLSCPRKYEETIEVECFTLDGWYKRERLKNKINKPIRLMKLEAEGFEPEILQGGLSTLSQIEYIAADLGWERGPDQECTIPQVVNLLLAHQFRLKSVSRDGVHFLFENMTILDDKSKNTI